MREASATLIQFEDDRTTLEVHAQPTLVVPVGARSMALQVFRHDPPSPAELERAIDRVEDALASTGLRQAARGHLVTGEALLMGPLGLRSTGEITTRDEVEMAFQRLASIARGHPQATCATPTGREQAAMLLILRECMHHLGYEGVRGEDSRPDVGPPHYN